MSSKTDKDKAKQLQDKCQSVLNGLLRDDDNKYCVDCDSKGPRWASWNIGIFLCIRCAGIHRNLGVHISKVKSVNLDSWTPEQVVSLQQMGNSRARAVYEATLPDNFRRPQSDASLETFIRAKYEHKKYIAREWVPPSLPKVNWEKEIDEEMEKQKRKKKATVEKKPVAPVEVPQLPKPTNPSPKPSRVINSVEQKNEKKNSDLLGIQNGEDSFSNFLSAPPTALISKDESVKKVESDLVRSEEESFFNQALPSEKEKVKLDKDSILALYGNAPSQNSFNAFPNVVQYPQGNFAVAPTQQNYQQGFGAFPQGVPSQQPYMPLQNGGVPQQQPSQFMVSTGQWTTTGNWPKQPQQITQYPTGAQQNQTVPVQYNLPNQFPTIPSSFQNGQFPNSTIPTTAQQLPNTNQLQIGQQYQMLANQMPNPFYASTTNNQTTNLPQQFGNLNLGNASATSNNTASTAALATNIWQ